MSVGHYRNPPSHWSTDSQMKGNDSVEMFQLIHMLTFIYMRLRVVCVCLKKEARDWGWAIWGFYLYHILRKWKGRKKLMGTGKEDETGMRT